MDKTNDAEREAFLQWVNKRPYAPSQIVSEWIHDAWHEGCAWQRAESAKACDSVVDQSKNSLFRSGAKICAGTIRSMSSNQTERCDRPPEGWHCTRAAGHSGPCAAFDAEEFQTLLGYDDSGEAVFGTDPDARAALAAPPPASTNKLTAWRGGDIAAGSFILKDGRWTEVPRDTSGAVVLFHQVGWPQGEPK